MHLSPTQTIDANLLAAAAGRVPGVTAIVVGPEGIRARGSTGWADLPGRMPMSTDVAMPWFSMTKLATSTLAVKLAGHGCLDLDEPVADVVTELGSLTPRAWARRITARHLIQHAAGLANPLPVRWIHPPDHAGRDQDELLAALLARHARLRAEPGTQARYSNLGALVLATALTRTGGARFETLLRQHVLDPLEMSDTGLDTAPEASSATGYHSRADPLRLLLPQWVIGNTTGRWVSLNPFAVDGAAYGGLIGTAGDAARFLRMHLADGALDGTRILSPEQATGMRQIDRPGRRYDFGLGWFRPRKGRTSQPTFVQHLGTGAGFRSVMRIYPAAVVGVVVMGNATAFDVDGVAKLALGFRS